MDVGGMLRRVRRVRGWSQRDLAAEVGVSPGQVAKWETGAVDMNVATLERILDLVGARLSVVDDDGSTVLPMGDGGAVRDLGGRRFPAHLDVRPSADAAYSGEVRAPARSRGRRGARWKRNPGPVLSVVTETQRRQRATSVVQDPWRSEHLRQSDAERWVEERRAEVRQRVARAQARARQQSLERDALLGECACLLACHDQGPCTQECPCQCENIDDMVSSVLETARAG